MTQWNRGKSFLRKWSLENHLLEQIAKKKFMGVEDGL
jgi:hypothetical protein